MDFKVKPGEFPKIMGILNVTPDSFSDGGMYNSVDAAVAHGLKLLDEGADILDIGGESTRPGADNVSGDEEIHRVIPVIKVILQNRPQAIISIDTTKYSVAKMALDNGAAIINDISGLENDEKLAALAVEYNAPLVLMHLQGQPRTMQQNPVYGNVVEDIFNILKNKIEFARSNGVKEIIADIGIGFGKTLEHNITLLRNIERFQELGVPLLLGISRKRFIGGMLGIDNPVERDYATTIIHSQLPHFGGDIIRVHNVGLVNTLKKVFYSIIA